MSKSATKLVLRDSSLTTAHIGISVFEPATSKYWFNYQGDHYFVPASNTKIPTCYAAMKYLGDSLVGLRYGYAENDGHHQFHLMVISPTGDPTFLHADYKNQPVFDFLRRKYIGEKYEAAIVYDSMKTVEALGSGWSWNDYDQSYMAERNSFPVFGNVLEIRLNDSSQWVGKEEWPEQYRVNLFKTQSPYFDSLLNSLLGIRSKTKIYSPQIRNVSLSRDFSSNQFQVNYRVNRRFTGMSIPFVTNGHLTTQQILHDSLKISFSPAIVTSQKNIYTYECPGCDPGPIKVSWNTIHSQPTDSLLKPMMHRSDNFFAEQSLLMVSNELLGYMNDEKIIDTLLKTDFKDLPQKPRWVDGSGLSRYNLFSPQDFVAIFNKMKNEFGMDRIKNIFPTGNEGTLTNYYKAETGYLFGKTGTLSGVVALSGFLYTKKNKLLIFSVLVNNHNNSSSAGVRRAVEKFIENLRNNY